MVKFFHISRSLAVSCAISNPASFRFHFCASVASLVGACAESEQREHRKDTFGRLNASNLSSKRMKFIYLFTFRCFSSLFSSTISAIRHPSISGSSSWAINERISARCSANRAQTANIASIRIKCLSRERAEGISETQSLILRIEQLPSLSGRAADNGTRRRRSEDEPSNTHGQY